MDTPKIFKKSILGLEISFFKLQGPQRFTVKNGFLSKIQRPQISGNMFNLLPFNVGCESFGYIGNLIWQIGEKEIFLIDLHLFWFTMKIYIFNFAIFQFYICKSWNCCPLLPYKGCMKQLDIIRKLIFGIWMRKNTPIYISKWLGLF